MSRLELIFFITFVLLGLVLLSTASLSGFNLFGSRTTSTTVEPPTTKALNNIFLENTVPKIADGCTGNYVCKKKVKVGTGRVCSKYCLKKVVCPPNVNGVPPTIDPTWCFILNPDTLEEPETTTGGTVAVMQVNMIDFPCQPGYLPDSRGRCREIW